MISERSDHEETIWIPYVDAGDEIVCGLDGIKISWLIDSGCSVDIITEKALQMIEARNGRVELKAPNREFRTYASKQPLNVKGFFEGSIEHNGRSMKGPIYVVPEGPFCLMGNGTAKKLGVLKVEKQVSWEDRNEM